MPSAHSSDEKRKEKEKDGKCKAGVSSLKNSEQ
jgi:hypothetical protein